MNLRRATIVKDCLDAKHAAAAVLSDFRSLALKNPQKIGKIGGPDIREIALRGRSLVVDFES